MPDTGTSEERAFDSLVKKLRGARSKRRRALGAVKKPAPEPLEPRHESIESESEGEPKVQEDGHSAVGGPEEDVLPQMESKSAAVLVDPFAVFMCDEISAALNYPVAAAESGEWVSKAESCPVLGDLNLTSLDGVEKPFSTLCEDFPPSRSASSRLCQYGILERLHEKWTGSVNKKALKGAEEPEFTRLQARLLDYMYNYRDLLFQSETEKNIKQIRDAYTLHSLNHVIKSRTAVFKNNAKLQEASLENIDIPDQRDQGFTRPKVLILVPFRQSAFEIVSTITTLCDFKLSENKNRFKRSFSIPPADDTVDPTKPDDHNATFKGNIDDCFKVGVRISHKSMTIMSDIYQSDYIIASPLGLRMMIEAEGKSEEIPAAEDKGESFTKRKRRKAENVDFLSSIEMCIVDQADALLMQNWEHVQFVLERLNRLPCEARGCDFSRVKTFNLDDRYIVSNAKYQRQTMLFSRFASPELNQVFRKLLPVRGKVKIKQAIDSNGGGTVCNVISKVPQVFYRVDDCASPLEVDDARFKFFVEKTLANLRTTGKTRTILYIPSYFDLVRVKGYLKQHKYAHAALSEYTTPQNISRARLAFFKGDVPLLLITERMHYFKRYFIRGSVHLVFYACPERSDFYAEFCNRLDVEKEGEASVSVLYTPFDSLRLERIVGPEKAAVMCGKGSKGAYMFS